MTNKTVAPKAQIPTLFDSKALGLVDREREIKQLIYALFTREHMLLMGPPGTAKSQFANNVFGSIDGAKNFEIHLTKQTTEEYVFGPLNIDELKKGNVIHNTKDSLLEADFAFIDEFFDASDVLLRSLLGVLNERVWMKGAQKVQAKLHTAILTSNYQRENEITEAILDRIIFKAEIQPVTQKSKRLRIYQDYLDRGNFSLTKLFDLQKLKDFTTLVDAPNSVNFPKDVLDIFDTLLQEYMKESKKYISQRTANKALKVLKVSALLNQREEVDYSDLEELKYVFCVLNRKIDEELFNAVYEKHVGKVEEERLALQDLNNIETKVNNIPNDFANLTDQEFITRMREINEFIHILESMQTPTQPISQKRDHILKGLRQVVEKNRDKLFTRKTDDDDSKQKPTEPEPSEPIDGEVIEDVDAPAF